MVVFTFCFNGLAWVLAQWENEYETLLARKGNLLIANCGNYFCRALYFVRIEKL